MLKKRYLALALALTMTVTGFVGCGSADSEQSAAPAATEKTETTVDAAEAADAAATAIAERKAKAEETREYQKVVVSFFDWTGAPKGIDRVNAKLSEHTRETLGLDVELLIIDSAAYSEDLKLMLSS